MPSRLPDGGPRERVTAGKHACRSIAGHGRIRGWNLDHTVGSGRYHAASHPAREHTRHQNPHDETASSGDQLAKDHHCRPPTMNIYIPVAGSVRLAKRERDATRPSQSPGMTMFAFNFTPRTLDARIAQWDLYFIRA
ncbi:hypothetical protein CH63R_07936 [Colletotrichum higginsianum IMI 349063]|uniref:Uncharacterized protein n=1 Tax=Colletotrichum higginsianum (strain IMI 349063) TaxID=759273 RepID=A0A1B7YAP5_COLHI|nr:hypothetical protein CH63R_07936 [Colletotrichum higginsianum IMI 349063]OBR09171.1 hypothetical protein CH63R_07936 [Colletotrichum higginsianum IMI 349063]